MAKPGSTAKRLVVHYGELNKKTLNHSGSIPNMESTLEKIASCRYKTKMDKRSGFWQVDLTPNAQELLAFITPQGRVFKWKVMPFGVANTPALFQELMNKMKVLPWVVDGAGGLGAGKTSGAGTRGVDLNAAVGGRTGCTDTNGGESSNNGSKIHVDCYPAENPSL